MSDEFPEEEDFYLSDEIPQQPEETTPEEDDDAYDVDIFGLPDRSSDESLQSRDELEFLMSNYLDELRQGLMPRIEDYQKRFPQHAEEIGELFPLVTGMEQWKVNKEDDSAKRVSQDPIKLTQLGPYQLIHEIGRGGQGVVFKAIDLRSSQHVALKLLSAGYARSERWRKQFQTEARLAAQLQHSNIVSVLDFGEEEGSCYYTMQMIQGVGLDWLIRKFSEGKGIVYAQEIETTFESLVTESSNEDSRTVKPEGKYLRRYSWKQLAKMGRQIAKALQYAHHHSTLHRDIKPSNLLIDSKGLIWITDFGLAQNIDQKTDIQSAILAGTLRYMAPECLEGIHDERSDLYAFGATLYELLTLRPMYMADNPQEMIHLIQQEPIVPPHEIVREIPRDLEAIVLKAVEKHPEERYQTARHMKEDLGRFLKGERVDAPPAKVKTNFMKFLRRNKS